MSMGGGRRGIKKKKDQDQRRKKLYPVTHRGNVHTSVNVRFKDILRGNQRRGPKISGQVCFSLFLLCGWTGQSSEQVMLNCGILELGVILWDALILIIRIFSFDRGGDRLRKNDFQKVLPAMLGLGPGLYQGGPHSPLLSFPSTSLYAARTCLLVRTAGCCFACLGLCHQLESPIICLGESVHKAQR